MNAPVAILALTAFFSSSFTASAFFASRADTRAAERSSALAKALGERLSRARPPCTRTAACTSSAVCFFSSPLLLLPAPLAQSPPLPPPAARL